MTTHSGGGDTEALTDLARGQRAVLDEQVHHRITRLTIVVRIGTEGRASGCRTSGGHGIAAARGQHNIVPHGFHNTSVT
ncbi:hypothetical protein GOALK_017_00560 [Gordonia alkanivorans NBRC 16433]|uniref:Uncharacterized protein n=1 Tax=Gordonia alkanivorans NBRC 16433 TaxID=1027371 RepID=F9VR33_9ACTN|nr:hypothetical protein GOALK_017_00560 [Gordonia alkanivorans NBRC 16433]